MEKYVTRAEFEDFCASLKAKLVDGIKVFAEGAGILGEITQLLGSTESFYCRKCDKIFPGTQLGKISGLTVSCPKCGEGLIPTRNLKAQAQQKDEATQ